MAPVCRVGKNSRIFLVVHAPAHRCLPRCPSSNHFKAHTGKQARFIVVSESAERGERPPDGSSDSGPHDRIRSFWLIILLLIITIIMIMIIIIIMIMTMIILIMIRAELRAARPDQELQVVLLEELLGDVRSSEANALAVWHGCALRSARVRTYDDRA